jgi:hypothetical protein
MRDRAFEIRKARAQDPRALICATVMVRKNDSALGRIWSRNSG